MRRSLVCVALLALGAYASLAAHTFAQQTRQPTNKELPLTPQQFVTVVSTNNLAEIDMAKMALKHSNNPDIQTFAQRMIRDHSKLNKDLEQVAKNLGFHAITELPKKQRQQVDKLAVLTGTEFNRTYTKDQLTDHKKLIGIFEREAKGGQNPELRKFAAEALPMLKNHLKLAEKLPDAKLGTTHTGR